MIATSPSSFNSLLQLSLVLYKLYIVWCHCWCIIEQHFVCCSWDWRYRFIRKIRPCSCYFWKEFHDSPQVFWWNLFYMSIYTQQWQPWNRSLSSKCPSPLVSLKKVSINGCLLALKKYPHMNEHTNSKKMRKLCGIWLREQVLESPLIWLLSHS